MSPPAGPRSTKRLDGNHILYRYLQGELLSSDVWLFQMLAARLIVGLGVWLGRDLYESYPLLRPYAVRDPKCRGNRARGEPDQWGSPNEDGLFRDDNSLIKQMPYSFPIRSPQSRIYANARIERGYVACHVWRQTRGELGFATRQSLTYSFVPNLVWLPREVSKLTDREGSFVQAYVQALSWKLYRQAPVRPALQATVDAAWDLLPEPIGIPTEGLPDAEELNTFVAGEAAMKRWIRDLGIVIDALRDARAGRSPARKVIASRYGAGLTSVSKKRLDSLADKLSAYRSAVS
jgi:hypothetical protein